MCEPRAGIIYYFQLFKSGVLGLYCDFGDLARKCTIHEYQSHFLWRVTDLADITMLI